VALQEAHVLVVGVARNCEDSLVRTFEKLGRSLSAAKKLSFFIVESDSSDATRNVLEKLSVDHANFKFTSLGNLSESFPKRTERIAICRNTYLDELDSNPDYRDADFVIVADWDGVNDLLSQQAVASCWLRDDWDVCAANQAGPYYDIWALRHSLWSPNDCWEQQRFLAAAGLTGRRATRLAVHSRMLAIPSDSDWIEVQSAFGGLAIYRKEALEAGRYVGLSEYDTEVCEHVSLNAAILSKGGKLFINPALINTGVVDHARYATRRGRIIFLAREWLKKLVDCAK